MANIKLQIYHEWNKSHFLLLLILIILVLLPLPLPDLQLQIVFCLCSLTSAMVHSTALSLCNKHMQFTITSVYIIHSRSLKTETILNFPQLSSTLRGHGIPVDNIHLQLADIIIQTFWSLLLPFFDRVTGAEVLNLNDPGCKKTDVPTRYSSPLSRTTPYCTWT